MRSLCSLSHVAWDMSRPNKIDTCRSWLSNPPNLDHLLHKYPPRNMKAQKSIDPGYFSREISSCPKFPNIKFIMEFKELSDPRSTSHVLTMAWKVVEKMRRSSGWSYFAGSFMKRRLSQSIHIIPHSRVSNWVSNKACSMLSTRRGQIHRKDLTQPVLLTTLHITVSDSDTETRESHFMKIKSRPTNRWWPLRKRQHVSPNSCYLLSFFSRILQ